MGVTYHKASRRWVAEHRWTLTAPDGRKKKRRLTQYRETEQEARRLLQEMKELAVEERVLVRRGLLPLEEEGQVAPKEEIRFRDYARDYGTPWPPSSFKGAAPGARSRPCWGTPRSRRPNGMPGWGRPPLGSWTGCPSGPGSGLRVRGAEVKTRRRRAVKRAVETETPPCAVPARFGIMRSFRRVEVARPAGFEPAACGFEVPTTRHTRGLT